MAFAASLSFQKSFRASRFTEALNAFFPESKTAKPENSRLNNVENDLLELSPYNQIRQTISQFRQEMSSASELNVTITMPAEKDASVTNDPILDRDLDIMLRMISTDDEDYQRLKTKFQNMLSEVQSPSNNQQQKPEIAQNQAKITVAHTNSLSQRTSRQTIQQINAKFNHKEKRELSPADLGIIEVDPLVLDLNGDGLNLTKAGEGASFDINADGKVDSTAWVQGDDALLVYDQNGNGKIDNGKELFGDQNGAKHGFAELGKHDKNNDGKINNLDPIYKALKLYQDLNGNGKMEKNEFFSLEEKGIKTLNLDFVKNKADLNGNSLILSGNFERNDGTLGHLADVLLGYRNKP